MPSLLDRMYARAPVIAQHAMVSAFGARWYWRRFGPGFRREVDGFLARARYSKAEWRAYQETMLRELLQVAWTRIPYYQRAWRGLGLDERAFARFRLEDLPLLPVLEKDAPRAEPEAFCIDGRPPPGGTHPQELSMPHSFRAPALATILALAGAAAIPRFMPMAYRP